MHVLAFLKCLRWLNNSMINSLRHVVLDLLRGRYDCGDAMPLSKLAVLLYGYDSPHTEGKAKGLLRAVRLRMLWNHGLDIGTCYDENGEPRYYIIGDPATYERLLRDYKEGRLTIEAPRSKKEKRLLYTI